MTQRVCYVCGSNETYISKKGQHQWFNNSPIGWLCSRCNHKYIVNPKWHPITCRQRLVFKHKQLHLRYDPRIGVCNWCRAVRGEVNTQIGKKCKRTSIHHIKYHEENPFRDIVEICASCHARYHRLSTYFT